MTALYIMPTLAAGMTGRQICLLARCTRTSKHDARQIQWRPDIIPGWPNEKNHRNGVWAPLEDLQPEEWDKTLETNLKGTFLTLKYSIPHLKQRGGSIIVTASINGTRKFTSAGASAYSSSKAGQVALAKMAALELARHRIRVNVICPGAIKTEIEQSTEKRDVEKIEVPVEFPEGSIPLTGGKPGKPEQVAQLVLFLASDASDLITGTEVWIDGAESLIMG